MTCAWLSLISVISNETRKDCISPERSCRVRCDHLGSEGPDLASRDCYLPSYNEDIVGRDINIVTTKLPLLKLQSLELTYLEPRS